MFPKCTLTAHLHQRSGFQRQSLATAVSDLTWKWLGQLSPLEALYLNEDTTQ